MITTRGLAVRDQKKIASFICKAPQAEGFAAVGILMLLAIVFYDWQSLLLMLPPLAARSWPFREENLCRTLGLPGSIIANPCSASYDSFVRPCEVAG